MKYWIWLTTRPGIGPYTICRLLRRFHTAEAVYFAAEADYAGTEGLRHPAALLDKDLTEAETILARCQDKGISLLTMQDAAYPRRLRICEDAPALLYYRGRLPDFDGPVIGVVGTRKASAYGMTQTRRLSCGLARCGCTVVTGGARGIDTEALKGALTGGGTVAAIFGCGVDVIYPAENRRLFEEVTRHGCLISEYPPGTKAYAGNFPVRNRIISGLSLGVLVAEAPEKSGALITAHHALEQGRDVFTLPANVGVKSCSGNLKLLRDGAIPVGTAWDLVQEYAGQYPEQLRRQPEPETVPEPEMACQNRDPEVKIDTESKKDVDKPEGRAYIDVNDVIDTVSRDEQLLLRLLASGPVHIDVLAEQSQLGSGRALASLTLLEVKGIVQRPKPGLYELRPAGK